MNVGPYQTLELVQTEQVRGKVLPNPGGEDGRHFLVEILETSTEHDWLGLKVIVAKEDVVKYQQKDKGENTFPAVIFDEHDILAQYAEPDDERRIISEELKQIKAWKDKQKEADDGITKSDKQK